MKIVELPGSRVIGAPRDWDQTLDGSCGQIFVLDAVDVQSGLNQMFTFYRFSDEDIDALKAGGFLRLGILGRSHPVFNMTIIGPKIAAEAGAEDRWQIGEVVDAA